MMGATGGCARCFELVNIAQDYVLLTRAVYMFGLAVQHTVSACRMLCHLSGHASGREVVLLAVVLVLMQAQQQSYTCRCMIG